MSNSVKTGSVVAAGAAINVSLGYVPEYVKVVNVTDGNVIYEWFDSMTAGTAIKTDLAVATQANNGISAYAGSLSAPPGFTLGTAIAVSGKTLAWCAVRSQND